MPALIWKYKLFEGVNLQLDYKRRSKFLISQDIALLLMSVPRMGHCHDFTKTLLTACVTSSYFSSSTKPLLFISHEESEKPCPTNRLVHPDLTFTTDLKELTSKSHQPTTTTTLAMHIHLQRHLASLLNGRLLTSSTSNISLVSLAVK